MTASDTIRHRRGRPGLLALLALVFVFAGCSGESRYEVLSFFFDGVPDPNAPPDSPAQSRITRTASGTTFLVHEPFMTGDCSVCHVGEFTGLMTADDVPPNVCLDCHAHVPQSYPIMHGPVAALACGQCHNPHRSTAPHLLRLEPRDMCLQCHLQEELGTTVAEHHDGLTNCITCHSGHGGTDRDLLKPITVTALNEPSQGERRGER